MMLPKVSIIIPAFNAEKYVARCLKSVLSLQYPNFEVIVVNDGSTDSTARLLDEYACKDERIKVVHKENGGVSSARNSGIEYSVGEWYAFVDIDDFLSDDFLQFDDFDTGAGLIVKNWKYTDGDSHNEMLEINQKIRIKGDSKFEEYMHYSVFRTPWAKLYRADIIESNHIRFNPKFKLGEDHLFVLDYLLCVNDVCISDGIYYYQRPHNGKYQLTYNGASSYLHAFAERYYEFKVSSPLLLKNKLNWYMSFIADFTFLKKIKWYQDRVINRMYLDSIKLFDAKTKIKVYAFRLLNLILK